jgi:hypothetical protein
MTRDPKSSPDTPYPRVPRGPNNADPYFDPRSGTQLPQESFGIATGRYGQPDVHNVGSLGDTGTPGSQLHTSGRYRSGERPSLRGARRMPPYGTRSNVTHVIPVADRIEQESQTSQNAHRKPALRGVLTQPRSKRPSRKQVRIAKLLTQKCELLCLADYLKREQIAKRMAQLVELKVIHESLRKEQQEQALQQADEVLRGVGNSTRFIKGYHSDGSHFAIWEKAMQLYKQERKQGPTMKGLKEL